MLDEGFVRFSTMNYGSMSLTIIFAKSYSEGYELIKEKKKNKKNHICLTYNLSLVL